MTRKVEVTQRQMLQQILEALRSQPESFAALIGQGREMLEHTEKAQETTRMLTATVARLLKENDSLRGMIAQMTIARLNFENRIRGDLK